MKTPSLRAFVLCILACGLLLGCATAPRPALSPEQGTGSDQGRNRRRRCR